MRHGGLVKTLWGLIVGKTRRGRILRLAFAALCAAWFFGLQAAQATQNDSVVTVVYGSVDHVQMGTDSGGQSVATLTGWAKFPDRPNDEVALLLFTVRHDRDGEVTYPLVRADQYRPDVDDALGIGDYHGFRVTLPAQAGDVVSMYRVLGPELDVVNIRIGDVYLLSGLPPIVLGLRSPLS